MPIAYENCSQSPTAKTIFHRYNAARQHLSALAGGRVYTGFAHNLIANF